MERRRPIDKYEKKQQKEWLDNILPVISMYSREQRGKAPLVW